MPSFSNIKKQIAWKNMRINLYEVPSTSLGSYNSISNIRALDEFDKVIWEAEIPKTHYDSYYDIQLDSAKNLLIATSAVGFRYLIRLEDGKILDYYLVK